MIPTVLSIGHNKGMNNVISTIVANSYQIVTSDNVFYAMQLLKDKPAIALIIIDIDSQTKESVEFIRHISSSKVYCKPCIVFSNLQSRNEIEAIVQTKLHDHFLKPFDPMELVKSIGKLGILPKNEGFRLKFRKPGSPPGGKSK